MSWGRSSGVAALVAVLCLALGPASAQATTLSWASPVSISTHPLRISCPSASLCVAVDGAGNVITSTNPAGGSTAWTSASVSSNPFTAVSCASSTFCVAMDNADHVWTATDPTGTWTDRGALPNTFDVPYRLSCPTASLCFAVDINGTGIRTTTPTGTAGTSWTVTTVSDSETDGLSCASTSLCIAASTNHKTYYSTSPATDSSWSSFDMSNTVDTSLYGVSCAPNTTTCVMGAAGSTDNLLSSTDLTAGYSAWTPVTIDSGHEIFSLSCPTTTFCAGGDISGGLVQSSDPTGPASAWSASPGVDGTQIIIAISCPDETLCVAVDQAGNAIVGTVASYSLTVSKAGAGAGTVTSSPAGIDCGATCSAPFDGGSTVTLTAVPAAGSTFAGWYGGGCSGTGSCMVTMTGATGVTATFVPTPPGQNALTVIKAGSGSGTVTSTPGGISCGSACSANFTQGQLVTLSEAPAAGSQFAGWSGACSGTGGCQVTMNANATVTATFKKLTHSLVVNLSGDGKGSVSSNPTGLDCHGKTCAGSFDDGTTVTLFPNPQPGFAFGGWSGAGCSGLTTCRITITGDDSLFASFFKSPVQIGGNGTDETIRCASFNPCYIVIDIDDCIPPHQCIGASLFAGDSAALPRVLGHAKAKIPARRSRTIHIKLNAAAKRYLRKHHRLKVTELIVTRTGKKRSVTERKFTLVFK